jgi:hypothetical protein
VCPVCKGAHDISQCQKEKAQLKREAKERGDKLPGGTPAQNTSKRSQQVDTQTEEESAPETYINICDIPKRDAITTKKYESRTQWLFKPLLTSLAEKSFAERSKASGGSHNQPQAPRNTRADRRGHTPQGQAAHPHQQMHSIQQMQPQGFKSRTLDRT